MLQPSTPHTPENWGAVSRGYAERVAPIQMEVFADEFVERLDVDAGTEALEVAAGSGALTATLARSVKSLLATDFAPKMVDVLRERMQAAGATNVTFDVMDGQALTLDDASFDRAACSFALMLFPDRAKGFSELRRVLRPGGRAVVSGWAGRDKFEKFGLFLAAVETAFPDLPQPPGPRPVFGLSDPADFKAQMEAAGFSNVEVDFVPSNVELASLDELWDMLTVGTPPVQVLFDRVGPGGSDRIHDALAGIVGQRFGSGPIRMTNVATFGRGTVR